MASKKCSKCAIEKTTAHYIAVNSKIHNGSLPICRECIGQMISNEKDEGKKWNLVNRKLAKKVSDLELKLHQREVAGKRVKELKEELGDDVFSELISEILSNG